jgi:hypothetical protein
MLAGDNGSRKRIVVTAVRQYAAPEPAAWLRRARTLATAAALVAAVALASAATASANTFSGVCQLTGHAFFAPAITALPKTGLDAARASGSCDGAFTDDHGRRSQLHDAPVTLAERQHGLIWCVAGASAGSGALDFAAGPIAFEVSEQRGPGVATLELTGARGGSALGLAAVTPTAIAPAAQSCMGAGLASAPIHLTLVTTTAISG